MLLVIAQFWWLKHFKITLFLNLFIYLFLSSSFDKILLAKNTADMDFSDGLRWQFLNASQLGIWIGIRLLYVTWNVGFEIFGTRPKYA